VHIILASTDPVAATASPWTPIITGCFLIAGALISLGSTWFVDWRKGRRDHNRRFDADLAKHGADFLLHADEFNEQIKIRRTPWRSPILGEPSEDEVARRNKEVEAADEKGRGSRASASRTLDLLSFIAPAGVTDTARAHLMQLDGAFTFTNFDYDSSQQRIEKSREQVVTVVREALALPTSGSASKLASGYKFNWFWRNSDGSLRTKRATLIHGAVLVLAIAALLFAGSWAGSLLGLFR
jgi:hypothetical protein